MAPLAVMLADARAPAVLAGVPLAVMFADAGDPAVLAPAPLPLRNIITAGPENPRDRPLNDGRERRHLRRVRPCVWWRTGAGREQQRRDSAQPPSECSEQGSRGTARVA